MKNRGVHQPIHSRGHNWWKQLFRVFSMGFDRPSASLETAKNIIAYPSRHILSQHPHSYSSDWVARVHQNRQHSKDGWKGIQNGRFHGYSWRTWCVRGARHDTGDVPRLILIPPPPGRFAIFTFLLIRNTSTLFPRSMGPPHGDPEKAGVM